MPSLVVTTSRKPTPQLKLAAQQWAQRLDTALVPRRDRSLPAIATEENVCGVLVIGDAQPTYYEPARGMEYFFHPNMAKVRIHNLKTARGDPMVTAMSLGEADEVLDWHTSKTADPSGILIPNPMQQRQSP